MYADVRPLIDICLFSVPSGNSIVKVNNLDIVPYPPSLPGQVKLSLDVHITEPLNNFDVNVTLIKKVFGFPLRVPCLNRLGSW